MSTLRILVVTNMYPPHHLGGYELSCQDVVTRWRARGHQVEVLTTTMRVPGVSSSPEERSDGVRRDLEFYWRDHRMLKPSLSRRFRLERGNQRALDRAIEEVRPDVVSFWHMGAMSFGLLQAVTERRLPMVLVVCDDWLVYGPTVDAWMSIFSRRTRLGSLVHRLTGVPTSVSLDPNAVAMCFNSEWVRKRAIEQSAWPFKRTTVVYSGIELGDFPAPDETEQPWSWRLISVGRVEERKGVHVAIEALARLPQEATLEVVGPAEGEYLERLKRSTDSLGLRDRVRFAGPIQREQIATRYRSADAFLFPVLWDEPFGLVPIEAMACGTPVVATGTGGSGEFLVDGVNCLRIPVGDPNALAQAVRRLAIDPALRHSLVRGGRATVERLTVDDLADELEAWHVAAAHLFRDGTPPDRAPISPSAHGRDSLSGA